CLSSNRSSNITSIDTEQAATTSQHKCSDSTIDNEYLFMLKSDNGKFPYAKVTFNDFRGNNTITMMIGTGASINVIDEQAYEQLNPKPNLIEKKNQAWGFQSDKPIAFMEQFTCNVSVNDKQINADFAVVKGREKCILSFELCKQLGIVKIQSNVHNINGNEFVGKVKRDYPNVFRDKV
ncbi:unnamed protein product, partial [Didymodactylos carnosus]